MAPMKRARNRRDHGGAVMHLRTPSSRPGQHRSFIRRTRIPATLQNGAAEVLADIDGLPVLFRILVKDAHAEMPPDIGSNDADLHSLLSSTLKKMVDQMRDRRCEVTSPQKSRSRSLN
jgi:hypothetical protein